MENIVLHNSDAIKLMESMPDNSIDVIITDPPYGINGNYNSFVDTKENLKSLIEQFLPQAKRIAKLVAIMTGVKNMELYNGCDWRLAWVVPAGNGMGPWGFNCWTPISVYGKDPYLEKSLGSRPDTFVDKSPKRKGYCHPYEKPESIMDWLINRLSFQNQIIFDPFMGSGTTGVSALKYGRKFIGCELDSEYFKVSEKRILQSKCQISIFDSGELKQESLF